MAIKPVISLTGGFEMPLGVPYPYQTSPARPCGRPQPFRRLYDVRQRDTMKPTGITI